MNDIQRLHQQAMDWAEQAEVAKRRGESLDHVQALLKQAFDQETLAADHLVDALEVEPTRSVIHRSAAALAIDCGDLRRN
jgi:hypothetical protein